MLSTKLVRPAIALCNVTTTRGVRDYPYYQNIADGDRDADLAFDVKYGIKPEPPSNEELYIHDKPRRPNRQDSLGVQATLNFFWRLKTRAYHFFGAPLPYMQTAEEKTEKRLLMDRLHEMYATIPQRYPDRQWYLDFLDHCAKYSDYDSMHRMYQWVSVYKINCDADVIEKFNDLMRLNCPVGIFPKDMSPWKQQRIDELAYLPDSNPEAGYMRQKGPFWKSMNIAVPVPYEGSVKRWKSDYTERKKEFGH